MQDGRHPTRNGAIAPPDPPEEQAALEYRPDDPPDDTDELEELIDGGDLKALDSFLRVLHPADLAALLGFLARRYWPKVIARLSIARISDLMEELPDHLRDDRAEHLKLHQLTKALEEMASDDDADVLADLPEPLAQDVIESLPQEDRHEVETLLAYPEDTAGGLMQMEAEGQ